MRSWRSLDSPFTVLFVAGIQEESQHGPGIFGFPPQIHLSPLLLLHRSKAIWGLAPPQYCCCSPPGVSLQPGHKVFQPFPKEQLRPANGCRKKPDGSLEKHGRNDPFWESRKEWQCSGGKPKLERTHHCSSHLLVCTPRRPSRAGFMTFDLCNHRPPCLQGSHT